MSLEFDAVTLSNVIFEEKECKVLGILWAAMNAISGCESIEDAKRIVGLVKADVDELLEVREE